VAEEEAGASFYEWMKVGSRQSAKLVVPHLMELVEPKSVVDVGCGTGSWLEVFREHGVGDVLGYDADGVPRSLLEIAEEEFRVADVTREIEPERRFDLALCLEVAQFNPKDAAARIVANLTALAPVVLFSAGIPGQGGGGENQRWPPYWARHFEDHGFVCVDCVRPRIWEEPDVKSWYVQNMLLFADRGLLDSRPRLAHEYELAKDRPLSLVHPRVFKTQRGRVVRLEAELAERAERTAAGEEPPGSRIPGERA
jgi:SAM-dependent methyltransferase